MNELRDLERQERQNIEKMERYMQKMDETLSETGRRRMTVADIERSRGGNVEPSSDTKSAGWNRDSVEKIDPTGRPRRTTSTMRDREVRPDNIFR